MTDADYKNTFPCAYCGKVLPKSEFPATHFAQCAECRDGRPPQLTPAQQTAMTNTLQARADAFSRRYPWLAWLMLPVAIYFFWLAWREKRKPKPSQEQEK